MSYTKVAHYSTPVFSPLQLIAPVLLNMVPQIVLQEAIPYTPVTELMLVGLFIKEFFLPRPRSEHMTQPRLSN